MMKLELFQPLFCKIKLQYIEICMYLYILFACSPSVSLSVYNGSPVEFSADSGCRPMETSSPVSRLLCDYLYDNGEFLWFDFLSQQEESARERALCQLTECF